MLGSLRRQQRKCHFDILGDILASGKQKGAGRVEAYIDHLKALYGVQEDQELAKALGSTKAAIANWRRRDMIPASVENKISKRFGGEHFWWVLEDAQYHSRWEEDAYAISLHILENEALPEFSMEQAFPIANIALKGAIFKAVLQAVRAHIRDKIGDLDGVSVLAQCLDDYAAGHILALDQAISFVPLPSK